MRGIDLDKDDLMARTGGASTVSPIAIWILVALARGSSVDMSLGLSLQRLCFVTSQLGSSAEAVDEAAVIGGESSGREERQKPGTSRHYHRAQCWCSTRVTDEAREDTQLKDGKLGQGRGLILPQGENQIARRRRRRQRSARSSSRTPVERALFTP